MAFRVRPEWGTPAGTYVATMLDNGPAIRDHFGVHIPDSVVVVMGKASPVLTIINESDVVLPKVIPSTIHPTIGNQLLGPTPTDIAQIYSPSMGRSDVTTEQRAGLSALIEANEDLFAKSDADSGCTPWWPPYLEGPYLEDPRWLRLNISCCLAHLKRHGLAELYQSAYKENHGVETALICVQNDIVCALDDKKSVLLDHDMVYPLCLCVFFQHFSC